MIYVLTVRNKSPYLVTYKGVPTVKFVFEFSAPDKAFAANVIQDILSDFQASDPYVHREFPDAMTEASYSESYNANQSGLQIDWKVIG